MIRVSKKTIIILIVIVTLSFQKSTLLVNATPYWFKEGIYAKYISKEPEGMDLIKIKISDSEAIVFYCHQIEFTWRVLKVTDDKAQIGVLLQGFRCTRKKWDVLDEDIARELLQGYQERYNFTGGGCITVESETINATVCEDSYMEQTERYRAALGIAEGRGYLFNESYIPENFTRSGTFELNLKTSDIYVNGSPVGKNFLWAENPANMTGLEILSGLKIEDVREINSTILTYYGDFNAPIYMAQTNMISVSDIGLSGKDLFFYDGSSGLVISLFMPFSPLWEIMGVSGTSIADTYLQMKYRDEIQKSNKMPPFGLVLAETNIDFTKPAELPDEGPSKTAIAAAVGVAAILVALALWRWRR
ncbi:hypothetical protein [Thermococcus sp.]|uniref:hypothetical protein n=1 Tax=Thermococcus sp. TaxID=35749 RepID=UPI0025FD2FAF|nr:hypothetical protein [Thermococcus sp.]